MQRHGEQAWLPQLGRRLRSKKKIFLPMSKTQKKRSLKHLVAATRITDGEGFRLRDHDPDSSHAGIGEEEGKTILAEGVGRLAELQTRLYAEESWSVLAVFQAMDAAGKDGTIKHVMTGVNPQGVDVTAFKQPGPDQLAHGFLWRVHKAAPRAGRIAIFNRSHYEDVLVCRVHPDLIDHQHLPDAARGRKFWKHRLDDITAFERYMARQGTVVLKFFLNVSKAEQRRRFLSRIDEPHKNWKFSAADLAERAHWDAYQEAYEAAIAATATEFAPWYIVPADTKWFTHLIVVQAMIEALEGLDLKDPSPSPDEYAKLQAARIALEAEE
jgi:PPK2 family polyphosphate:nucleotide phosphotransferase